MIEERRTELTRRAVLGTGAAAAAGGLIVTSGAGTAEAANGDPVLAGRTNNATAATILRADVNAASLLFENTNSGSQAHAFIARGLSGYGMVASSETYNGGRSTTLAPSMYGFIAENNSATSGTGGALLAVHRSTGTGQDGAFAIRGIQGPDANALLTSVRSTFAPAAGEFAGGANGVIGASGQDGGIGVVGHSESGPGVHASTNAPGGDALFSAGNATVAGDLAVQGMISKFGGSFRIDHPLDPKNRYLSHSFVESPDMKNVYDGVVELDKNGAATVDLPEWFEALNRDFRYQLTPMGASAPDLYISSEITDGRFTIAGGIPGQRVSWQVTGIRKDPWAEDNRIPVEHDKPAGERGDTLYSSPRL